MANVLKMYAQSFRAVLLTGPRQSGKTTLVKAIFPNKPYVSLENPDESAFALNDPRGFLNRFPNGAILDEIQKTPLILNYLQEILDNTNEDGLFILTGSNNILLVQHTTQTLAGRIGVLDLMPLSYSEIYSPEEKPYFAQVLLQGFYPEVIAKKRKPGLWFPSYISTYVERDVRQIKQIADVFQFQRFLRLCAGRIGQHLNLNALSNACGINLKTTQSWLSILESTYIIHFLQPFYENFNKRTVKSPKLYFCDTGLACSLLNIKTSDELNLSHFRGSLFENLIVMENVKNTLNTKNGNQHFYWRENNGVEIDLLIQSGENITAIEIKSAQTFSKDFTYNLKKFASYSKFSKGLILYDGLQTFTGSDDIGLMNWRDFVQFE